MKYRLGILCLVLIFGCEQDLRPEKPANLISKDKMSEIFYDMFIVNSAKGVNRKILETNGVNPEAFILSKYEIDSLQFAQSNAYYAYDFDTYESILNTVEERLNKEKAIYEAIKEKEEAEAFKKKDSIKKERQKALEMSVGRVKDSAKIL